MAAENRLLQKVIALCSRHGYIYRGQRFGVDRHSLSNLYDLGPLGVRLKQNICHEWWNSMVTSQGNIYGTESPSSGPAISTSQPSTTVTQDGQNLNDRVSPHQGQEDDSSTKSHSTSVYLGTLLQYLRIKDLANKQLPFGIAQGGIGYRNNNSTQEVDRFIYDTQKCMQLSVQYYCSPKAVIRLLDTWQRERLNWWRKFAENPSNFIAADLQTVDDTQVLDIQYKFPWGYDTIERIYNHGKGPMEQHLTWLERGLIDVKDSNSVSGAEHEDSKPVSGADNLESGVESDIDGDVEDKTGTTKQKNLADLLKGRLGQKRYLPHTLEMTTTVEHGMLAYLLDGYTEKDVAPKSRSVGAEVVNLHAKLAPVKVAVVTQHPSTRPLEEISEFIQSDFRKSNINVIGDSRNSTRKEKIQRFDAMGVVFSVWVQEKTIKEGVVAIRARGEQVAQGQHITKVKEFVLRHLEHT